MKRTLIHNLSANAAQLIVNQVFGLAIFYILSTQLDKSNFGQINLVLAILLAVFNVLSMGIDQLIIKKVAQGEALQTMLWLYIFHVVIAGCLFYGILLAGKFLFASNNVTYQLLLLLGVGKLMIFFSTPFKQITSGLERFRLLAYMSCTSNILRSIGLIIFALLHTISMRTVVIVFIAGDLAELVIAAYLFRHNVTARLSFTWNKQNYIQLVREAIPQTGVVMITSALARFDWIFIGLMLSTVKLAEYSFAYKVFEMAMLPLSAIAPLLIPRFTKLFNNNQPDTERLKFLVQVEMAVAAFVVLALNVYWSPAIDAITHGKYGLVNMNTIFILSLCMPLLYLNNFLWTMYFAQGKLKMILRAFIITLIVNVVGDIVLIRLLANEGAALAFLLSCMAQAIFFLAKIDIPQLTVIWKPTVLCTACAVAGIYACRLLAIDQWFVLIVATLLYLLLLFSIGQIKLNYRQKLVDLVNL